VKRRASPPHRPREDGLDHPLQPLQDPIVFAPWLCFRGGGFPDPFFVPHRPGVIRGPNAYLRDTWNMLDFFTVFCALAALIEPNAMALRALRALRPMRLFSRQESMKLVVESLGQVRALLKPPIELQGSG
jgi:hypothetical protein